MKYLWIVHNSTLVALALWNGHESMTPSRLLNKNPDLTFCLIILLIMPLFALGSVEFSIRGRKVGRFARPSWDRNPFNWWGDPLQSLFITTCIMGAMAVGGATYHPAFGTTGFWMLGTYCCWAIGLALGQFLVYWIYRERIVSS